MQNIYNNNNNKFTRRQTKALEALMYEQYAQEQAQAYYLAQEYADIRKAEVERYGL